MTGEQAYLPAIFSMQRPLSILALTLLLAACGGKTVSYRLTFDTVDTLRRQELTAAAGRVVEGRMAAHQTPVKNLQINEEGESVILTAVAPAGGASADWLHDGLQTPFTMSIMKEVPKGQGDLVSEKFGEFKETGLGTSSFDWVSSSQTPDGKGNAVIQFTEEGKKTLAQVFAANKGKTIGIFVRGQLMSKKLVDATDGKQEGITVDGIPSAEVAAGFADDVNVGLHVTFTPIP